MRGLLSGTLRKKMGLTVTSTKSVDGERNHSFGFQKTIGLADAFRLVTSSRPINATFTSLHDWVIPPLAICAVATTRSRHCPFSIAAGIKSRRFLTPETLPPGTVPRSGSWPCSRPDPHF